MKKQKIEKNKIRIRDIPYISFDIYSLDGEINEVSNTVLNIKNMLREAYKLRKKYDEVSVFTPFEDYKYIHLKLEWDEGGKYFEVQVFRDETDEEFKKRLDANNKRSESAKIAAENRKKAQEKRERTLFENLKKKYG